MTLDDVAGRSAYDGDHEAFRQSVRQFLRKEGVPHVAEWEANRLVPPAFWLVFLSSVAVTFRLTVWSGRLTVPAAARLPPSICSRKSAAPSPSA